MNISVILSTDQDQGQVTKGHERSPDLKKYFLGMRHMFPCHFSTQNSKIEAILQSNPMQANNREGAGEARVKFLN